MARGGEKKMTDSNDMDRVFHEQIQLAQAYIPFQVYGDTFDLMTALKYGTLFPELYRPYKSKKTKSIIV